MTHNITTTLVGTKDDKEAITTKDRSVRDERTTKSGIDTDSSINRESKRKNTTSSDTDDTTIPERMTNDNNDTHKKNIIQQSNYVRQHEKATKS